MSYNLAPATAPWFEHLTDSVDALGEAAREWQLAARAAKLVDDQADPQRRVLHDGLVTGQPGPGARGWEARAAERSPHITAVFELQRVAMTHMHLLQNAYERAALVYASGAAWAVRQVQDGAQPSRVVLPLDDEDRRLVPGGFTILTARLEEARYVHARKVKAAHDRLTDCLHAGAYGEEIAGQEDISERDAMEADECATIAAGTADAAYTYGRLLQQALGFVLLGPCETRRKQRAEQRAAEARQTTEAADGQTGGAR